MPYPPTTRDYEPVMHSVAEVELQLGDIIRVEANTHSNGKVAEKPLDACGKENANGGRAWSRGRWARLVLEPLF